MSSRSSRGFTLIEVLLAILIFATGIVLVMEGMGRSQYVLGISQNLVTAVLLAEKQITQSELETLQNHKLRVGSEEGKEKVRGRDFKWFKQIQPCLDESIKDKTKLSQVDLKVEWKEGSRQDQVVLSALVLNREKKVIKTA